MNGRLSIGIIAGLSWLIGGGSNCLWATPETTILSPEARVSAHVFGVGESIFLQVEGSNLSDDDINNTKTYHVSYVWELYLEGETKPQREFEGETLTIVIDSPGRYRLECYAKEYDSQDPTPDKRDLIIVDRSTINPNIVVPSDPVVHAAVGEPLLFEAEVATSKRIDGKFVWEVTPLRAEPDVYTVEGQIVEISFPAPGRYRVRCAIVDEATGYVSPRLPSREVNVQQAGVLIAAPAPAEDGQFYTDRGDVLPFRGEIRDYAQQVARYYWRLEPNNLELCEDLLDCSFHFANVGPHGIRFVAEDSQGNVLGSDHVRVNVAGALGLRIVEPGPNAEFPVDTSFALVAEAFGTQASRAEVFWLYNGQVFPGNTLSLPNGVATPGYYQAEAVARIRGARSRDSYARQTVRVLIHDPNQLPAPEIISPRTDMRIPPGTTIFCDSSWRRTPKAARHLLWQIVMLGENGRVRIESFDPTLGRYTLNDPATYECRLFVRTESGNQLVSKRVIEVTDEKPASFDSNTSLSNAAAIVPGTYTGLELNREQYFSFLIGEDGLDVVIRPEFDGELIVRFYGRGTNLLLERRVRGGEPLQIPALDSRIFKVGFLPADSTAAKKTSFSFSVSVLNPGLYFPDIVDDGVFSTQVGMVNPGSETAETEILAYDGTGTILDKVPLDIPAGGQVRATVETLFPDLQGQVSWLRVDTTRDLVGFSQVEANDGMESYAVGGVRTLNKELFVPHIASDTQTWFTRASVVNGRDETADSRLSIGGQDTPLAAQPAYTKDGFDFKDLLGTIDESIEWGVFLEGNARDSLAGIEVFGKVDGTRQMVGLGLAPAPRDNANFTATLDTLYFTHVARDTANFWTGVALVNTTDAAQGAIVNAFGPDGMFLGQKTVDLGPGEKLVELADSFLAEFGGATAVDWLEVTSDGGMVGYELFGTLNTKQMAGLEAIDDVRAQLCFPYVDNTGLRWHGFSLVNITDSNAQVTFEMVDAGGNVLATEQTSLLGREKQIFVLRDLFGDIPVNAAWVRAISDQPIAGFQLFGTDETMSGLIAR